MMEVEGMTGDKVDRSQALRRANRRAATVVGLIALGIFVYTIARGFLR